MTVRLRDTSKLEALAAKAYHVDNAWMYQPVERGAIEAVRRYGHYTASKMMYKAGFPIYAALRIIQIAFVNGARFRKRNASNIVSRKGACHD